MITVNGVTIPDNPGNPDSSGDFSSRLRAAASGASGTRVFVNVARVGNQTPVIDAAGSGNTDGATVTVNGRTTTASALIDPPAEGISEKLTARPGVRDILTGGDGVDTFVIGEGGGRDVITDFDAAAGEVVELNIPNINSFEELASRARTNGNGNLVFDFDDGSRLVMRGVALEDLSDDNFVFNGRTGADA